MKKQIPEKVANKVYDKLLAGIRLERSRLRSSYRNWREELFYKPNTNEISNKFFKNKISLFISVCKESNWGIKSETISTRKQLESILDQINDYI